MFVSTFKVSSIQPIRFRSRWPVQVGLLAFTVESCRSCKENCRKRRNLFSLDGAHTLCLCALEQYG